VRFVAHYCTIPSEFLPKPKSDKSRLAGNKRDLTSPPAMEPPPPPAPATHSAPVRVLSRTPPPSSPTPSSAGPAPSPASRDGVVAVGFVGGAGSARLADRILDAHVFSPGGSAGTLAGSVRYHRDAGRRMVFLHLAPLQTAVGGCGDGDLPEMLFMFSVSSDSHSAFAH